MPSPINKRRIFTMNNKKIQYLTRTAVMLAITLIFMSLRLIPVLSDANPMSVYIIGSLVNLALLVACDYVGFGAAVFNGIVAPFVALLQGHQTLMFMVPVVAIGNIVLPSGYMLFKNRSNLKWLGVLFGSLLKFGFFLLVVPFVFQLFMSSPVAPRVAAQFLGYAQLITALIGGYVAIIVVPLLRRALQN